MNENWKAIKGYGGNYLVSDLGRVMRVRPGGGAAVGKTLKPLINPMGYPIVTLSHNGKVTPKTIHSLAVDAFLPGQRTKGMQVNHVDGVKSNNRLDNLEVVTRQQNVDHAKRTGLLAAPRHTRYALTDDQVREVRRLLALGEPMWAIADEYGVSRSTIYSIKSGRTRKDVA